MATSIHPLGHYRHRFGDADPTIAVGFGPPTKQAVGRYRVQLLWGTDRPGTDLTLEGLVLPQVTGPYKVAGGFVAGSPNIIELQFHSLTTGALVDPANGTWVEFIVFNP